MKNVSGKSCRESKNTYFIFNNFSPENLTVYETWKNMVEPKRPHMRIYSACAFHAG
jgi:hypothetical protein